MTIIPQSPVALVTGGARRIGRAIVETLAASGFAVAVHHHRSEADAHALVQEIGAAGGRAAVFASDLTDADQAETLVDRVSEEFGGPRLLVNNASLFLPDSIMEFDERRWDAHFALHVKAPAILARRLAARLPETESALVINIVDQRVLKPTPQFFSYTLSKSALMTATRIMAQALGPRIRVNAIGPGPTLANSRQSAADFDAQARALILGRGPLPAEIGEAVLYLWNAPSVTGQMIAVDGGQHLAWRTPDVTGMRE